MSGPASRSTAEVRDRLAREIARRTAGRRTSGQIEPRPAGEAPTASAAQQRLWFLDQLHPGGTSYNATMTMRLTGSLVPAALHLALDAVVARHEALRTTLVDDGRGRPVARLLAADLGVDWREFDLTAEPAAPAVGGDALTAHTTAAAAEPFDLGRDVMLRALLYRTGADEHVLLLVTHHIATDGWSRSILFDEIAEGYEAAVTGRPPDLPPLPVQYGDYARWQHRGIADGGFDATVGWWRTNLAGADVVTDLPFDHPAAAGDSPGSRLPFEDPGTGDLLRALGRSAAATPFMTNLALTALFLSALTGQRDIVVGSPSANRDRPEVARLIGFFVDTVVLRVRLDPVATVADLLHSCRTVVLEALAHPVPLDRLVDALSPRRVAGRNPLFQVNYRMQGAPPPPPRLRGLRAERLYTETGASRFELALGFVDAPGPLRGYLEYHTGRFETATIESWAAAVVALARDVEADPTATVGAVVDRTRSRLAHRAAPPPERPAPGAIAGPPSIRRRNRLPVPGGPT